MPDLTTLQANGLTTTTTTTAWLVDLLEVIDTPTPTPPA